MFRDRIKYIHQGLLFGILFVTIIIIVIMVEISLCESAIQRKTRSSIVNQWRKHNVPTKNRKILSTFHFSDVIVNIPNVSHVLNSTILDDVSNYQSDDIHSHPESSTSSFTLSNLGYVNDQEEDGEEENDEESDIFHTFHEQRTNLHNSNNDQHILLSSSQNSYGSSVRKRSPLLLSESDLKPIESTRPAKKVGLLDGNITLGGLMMVHERGETEICGQIMPQGGIHALECMLYTIDWVNRNKNILPGITLGAYILDDCDRDTYGLEQAVDFIKGSIGNISDGTYYCRDGSTPAVEQKVISGVLGAASSVTSIQVANLLRLFGIPQISFFSTSPELSNKERFKYFLRTVPSDDNQVQAMVEIIRRMNWTYIGVLYEESTYGIKAFEVLEELLKNTTICIAVKAKLPKDSGVADDRRFDEIVAELRKKDRARGVIVFGSDQEVKALMQAVKRGNLTGKYQWIGSDGWSARALVSDGNEEQVEGTLSIQPMSKPVEGFDEYFTRLDPKRNETLRRNPWFIEFWEHFFKCKWNGSQVTSYNQGHERYCTGNERMTENGYEAERQLQFVSDAVLAFAYAFHEMHKDKCGGQPGICAQMKPNDGNEVLKYLKNVSFTGLSGDKFKFSGNQDGPVRYNILHFTKLSTGYKWIEVGTYIDNVLSLQMDKISFTETSPGIPRSVCSDPCSVGEAKIPSVSDKCCWLCNPCSEYQIVLNEKNCHDCAYGQRSDPSHSQCVAITEEYVDINNPLVIGAFTFSTVGIITVTWIVLVFIHFRDTPVVRASGRELSFVLLFGLLSSYSVTYLLILRPTNFVCGLTHTMIGCSFSVVYSSILTKTNRIARIFDASKRSAMRPSFISPQSQLCICSIMIVMQVIITLMWFAFHPPKATYFHPQRSSNILKCSTTDGIDFFLAFAYPFILIFVCTVYAVLTRKIPEAFNESKHIGFTMYTTCVIWIAFIPIYITTRNDVTLNMISLSYSINASSTIAILCLFSAKLYIILLHPEKNIRQSIINTAKYGAANDLGLISKDNISADHTQANRTASVSEGRMESATQSEDLLQTEENRQEVTKNS
ncbi:metabotropic glutamate receptor 3-like [Brevipalpus obovatus]|uniref:metabotropic glutamate receptor 3-like n=1 Tax=Brevipalpus obovatus TaxID=246614 RepID=UPI003D9E4900